MNAQSQMTAAPIYDQVFEAFEVDDNIIDNLIHDQNGTVPTSLRELVLNAIDALSPDIHILIWNDGFEIKDSGCGFASEEDIRNHFKRFGTKHENEAIHGRFRIGRGQIMAFAKTTWHSNTFTMTTDVKNHGNGYHFSKAAEHYAGCRVYGQFYKPLKDYEVNFIISELTKLVQYASTPVFINQININPPCEIKWGHDSEDVQILFKPKGHVGVMLYSQGILVKELQRYRYGFSADIVTKRALQLNMARNEINENDPLWIKVHGLLRAELRRINQSKEKLTEDERIAFIDQFISDEMTIEDIIKMPMIMDCRGKPTSIYKQACRNRPWVVMAPNQERTAELISLRGQAFVLTQSELNYWGCESIHELVELWKTRLNDMGLKCDHYRYYTKILNRITSCEFGVIADGISEQHEVINLNELSKLERAQRNTLQYVSDVIAKRLINQRAEQGEERSLGGKRKIIIGRSDTATAWTDSATFIAVDKKALNFFDNGIPGIIRLVCILLHEYTHDAGSLLTNEHGLEFYEQFHNAILQSSMKLEVLGNAISSMQNQYRTELGKAGLPLPKWMGEDDQYINVHITLRSNKMTPLLQLYLAWVGLTPETGNGWIKIGATSSDFFELYKRFNKSLAKTAKELEIPFKTDADYDHLSVWEGIKKQRLEDTASCLGLIFDKLNIKATDDEIALLTRLSLGSRTYEFSGLNLLCACDGFGIKSMQRVIKRETRIMAGKSFCYGIQTLDSFSIQERDITAQSLEESGMEARFAYFQKTIKHVVQSITDPTERELFCQRLFNDPMTKVFGGNLSD